MIKVIWVARYKAGLSREAASRHWSEIHGRLAALVPGNRHYVQNHVVGPLSPGAPEPSFDGYSTSWFADRQAYDDGVTSEEWQALPADTPNLFDGAFFAGMSALMEEVVIKDGLPGGCKIAFVVRLDPALPRDQALAYWRDTHGPIVARIPELQRYVQSHATAALGEVSGFAPVETLHFDGTAELWFEDRAAFDRAVATPEWQAAGADGAKIFDMSRVWVAQVVEHPITD